jgi:sugar lactone lactonase YvrE
VKLNTPLHLLIVTTCCLLFVFCATQQNSSHNKPAFSEVQDQTLIPEGIAVHPITGKVYLSSLHQNKIVAVDENGAVTDIITSGQQRFMWGLGMKFSKDGKILWACSSNGKGNAALFAFDYISGKVIKKYSHDSARFLNDLVILDDGRIFVTDTEKGAVFLLQNDSLQLYLHHEQLKWANGICVTPQGDKLFVASGRYGLMKINISTHEISSGTNDKRIDYAIDGLVIHDHTLYAAIGWPQDSIHQHRILRYYLDEQFNYTGADTMSIGEPWLNCPTTLAVLDDQLYALSNTNLGIYNRHAQQITKIMDSLLLPVIAKFPLPKK